MKKLLYNRALFVITSILVVTGIALQAAEYIDLAIIIAPSSALYLIWLIILLKNNKSKASRYLPLTAVNFENYYPDFNYIEVFFIGNIWQSSTFEQGKEWQRNSNFVKNYLEYKEDYIKVKKDKGEYFKINDIAWSYYVRYNEEWVVQHIKRKIWTRQDVRFSKENTRNMSKFFKWVEKDKCREMLFNNDKEKRLLRKQLKEINEKLSTDKNEILINQKKEINIRIKEINDENKILVDKQEEYLKTWYD